MINNEMLIEFKKKRYEFKKRGLNITVNEERLKKIENALSEQATFFPLLGKSEQIDFMLCMLETYMFGENLEQLNK